MMRKLNHNLLEKSVTGKICLSNDNNFVHYISILFTSKNIFSIFHYKIVFILFY